MTWPGKVCPVCHVEKPANQYTTFSKKGKPEGRCLDCRRVYDRAWRERNRERVRAQARAYTERLREDHPEFYEALKERNRKACAKYRTSEKGRAARKAAQQRVYADPERHAAYLESRRLAYRLRQERLGRKVTRTLTAQMPSDPLRRLPVEPFKAWVEAKRIEYGGVTSLVKACSRGEHDEERVAKGLYRVRYGNKHVDLDFADDCLTREGSTTLNDLWPDL